MPQKNAKHSHRLYESQSQKGRSLSSRNVKRSRNSNQTKPSCTIQTTAILTRFLFLLHAGIALWRVSLSYPTEILYFLVIGIAFLLMEMVYTIGVRHGREYKWVSPSVLFYLFSIVPCLWLLELNQINQLSALSNNTGGCNFTVAPEEEISNFTGVNTSSSLSSSSENLSRDRRNAQVQFASTHRQIRNVSDVIVTPSNTIPTTSEIQNNTSRYSVQTTPSTSMASTKYFEFETTSGFPLPTTIATTKSNSPFGILQQQVANINKTLGHIDSETWLLSLHQVLLFVLVIGRWLLPKGQITRDQLSQLLLVFIGVGADILEFVTETIDHDIPTIRCNLSLHYIIYCVWSWSLVQFTLVLTATKSMKTRLGFSSERDDVILLTNRRSCCTRSIFNSADVWGILATLMLQDMPFLGFRLYIMIVYEQVHQMMVFFTGKNFLVVCLQIYRLIVLKLEKKSDEESTFDQSELQPLRGTLQRLAKHSGTNRLPSDGVIQEASIKRKNDGSVTVRISLSDGSKI